MIFTMDVGNTNIKCGLFVDGKLKHSWRLATNRAKTADEYGIEMESFFAHIDRTLYEVEGIIISSVIPSTNYTIEHMCSLYFRRTPMFVGPGIKTGMNIKYDNPRELGSDRICNALAAYKIYGGPCITIDFGTATTFGVVSTGGDFLGGAICPGLIISTDALVERTAKLPKVELIKPKTVIGKSTIHCIQSGLIYGYVGQVDYIVKKIRHEMGCPEALAIATGGMARLIASESETIGVINGTLTLEGLYMLYELNKG